MISHTAVLFSLLQPSHGTSGVAIEGEVLKHSFLMTGFLILLGFIFDLEQISLKVN